ncbi:MAG TPA: bifunctional alpha,alpha-trehalose-phosphate synthase (UDP-forming)/trehalose-phosphatase [Tepidisphaeraceae bacterium]|nr:bifunctional alpha,alpha-trehalose-phosphate synthase (UDP-forming)/trehalose-phosphatase [Tepidisphaeraceae bacterium]
MNTLINVSNRLPVTVGDDGTIKKSSGGLVAALEGLPAEQYQLKWIGWPGGNIPEARQAEVERQLADTLGAAPVFISSDEEHGFYEGFSNSSVWPLLHYMTNHFRHEPEWWDDYQTVNRRFADKVLSVARDGDLVWVHDYQLMLLPAMLKESMPSLRVGFFLHTPFPSYEVIRCHPQRDELVAGMLGADQVGFHTFSYMRHFRSSVLRLLGTDSEITRIRRNGHTTYLGVYPIGINARKFEQELSRPELAEQVETFRRTFESKRIVLSVERLDYTKGILRRLDAIDLFLSERPPEERDRIKFIFVSVPSREGVDEYRELREEIEYRIGRINGEYTTLHNAPVHFIHGSVNFTELAALYAMADACVVTPLIDGMNLVAKEYVAAQRDGGGVLVLSEFAGAAEEMLGAIVVNPYDTRAVADAIVEALDLPPEDRLARMQPMRQRVMEYDAVAWAKSFIDDLTARDTAPDAKAHADEAKRRLAGALREKQKVALMLDYDGTLREIEQAPGAARPNAAVHHVLGQLRDAIDRGANLDATIISGRSPGDLESFLGDYPFGLVAEHGATLRRAGQREWEQLDRNINYDWIDELLKLLRVYEASTPGSFIEKKRTSLVWHYRRADPEFGAWKAKQLFEELGAMTANDPLQVRHGRKIVEITASGINKGAAVLRLLEEKTYDLILAAGDDQTDEHMFRLDLRNLITIKVADGDTHATYRVPTPNAFRRLLSDALAT